VKISIKSEIKMSLAQASRSYAADSLPVLLEFLLSVMVTADLVLRN